MATTTWLTRALSRVCWVLSVIACLPTLPYAAVVIALSGIATGRRRRVTRARRLPPRRGGR